MFQGGYNSHHLKFHGWNPTPLTIIGGVNLKFKKKLPKIIQLKSFQLPSNTPTPQQKPTLEEAIDPTAELPRFNLGFWVVEDESFAESGRTSSGSMSHPGCLIKILWE